MGASRKQLTSINSVYLRRLWGARLLLSLALTGAVRVRYEMWQRALSFEG